jgi:hypothetical protein
VSVGSAQKDPKAFYTEALPAQWNRALEAQERAAEAAQRLLEGMRAVDATIRVDVVGDGGSTFFLNIEAGRLAPGDAPAHPPFLTLVQDRQAFERLVAEAGDSALGFLGGLSGLAGEMHLTKARLDNLADVRGCVRFEVTGEGGFALLTHFGEGPVPDAPDTAIRVDAEVYRALRAGQLNPQDAFMGGKLSMEGDMQLAMQVALAALSPD